jgi:hypothetical protein
MMIDTVQYGSLRTHEHFQSPAAVFVEANQGVVGRDVSSQLGGKIFVGGEIFGTFQNIHLKWKEAQSRLWITTRKDDFVIRVVGNCHWLGRGVACEMFPRSLSSG